MGTSAWRPLAVARGGRFTSKTDGGSHREDPPPNEAMYCRAKATEAKRCAVGQVLAMYCRFAPNSWAPPSSPSATASCAWGPRSCKPLSTSGKKGVPTVQHRLPVLRRGGPLRRLAGPQPRELARGGPPGAALLPLPALRRRLLSLGHGLAADRGRLEPSGRRGDL